MRTLPADARSDLWSRLLDATEIELDDVDRWDHGVILTVPAVDQPTIEKVLAVLDFPMLDRVEVAAVVDRSSSCSVVALMRECASRDVPIAVTFALDLEPIAAGWAHLVTRAEDERMRFELARRHGPGFVQIVDDRPGRFVRITFDDPLDVDLIRRLERPCSIADLDTADRQRLDVLTQFDLVFSIDGTAVLVAPRIKRWPVPLDDLFDPPTA